MNFENYECDGQLSLDDLYPKPCCGLTPWLHKSKCWMDGRTDIPQIWMMYYICPKCMDEPVDNLGWTIHARGSYEEAAAEAVKIWNHSRHEGHKKRMYDHVFIAVGEIEEWERLYGDAVDYMGRKKHE